MSVLHITKDTFEAEVMSSEKPVLLDFYATWCGPCKMISPIIDELSEEMTDVRFFKLDVDENPDVPGAFGIMSIPTILVFNNGILVNKVVGFLPKAALKTEIEK